MYVCEWVSLTDWYQQGALLPLRAGTTRRRFESEFPEELRITELFARRFTGHFEGVYLRRNQLDIAHLDGAALPCAQDLLHPLISQFIAPGDIAATPPADKIKLHKLP